MKRAPPSVPCSGSVPVPAYEIRSPPRYVVPAAGAVIVAVGGWFAVTVSVASLLVVVPVPFDTRTRKRAPLSDVCAEPSV